MIFAPTLALSFLRVDENNRKFAPAAGLSGYEVVKIYSFDDVTGFELMEGAEPVTIDDLNATADNGCSKNIVTDLRIRVSMKNSENSEVFINILPGRTITNSLIYRTACIDALKVLSLFADMTAHYRKN
jgi:hypothetical protein